MTLMKPLIVSAPFGNYIQPAGATATLGTFTAARRPGRLWRILKTVRYYPRIGAWVNKIGLRNPGMPWLVARARAGKVTVEDKIVSVHGFTPDDWWALLEQAASIRPLAIELNISCPNVGHVSWPDGLFARAVATGAPVIVKLPPVNWRDIAREAITSGVHTFHCCNTIPVPAGGLSGKPLKPVALQCIVELRAMEAALAPARPLTIIGGGGITTPDDIDDYARVGANHAAIGSKAMNPLLLATHSSLAPLIQRARERFTTT
jgi:dihydroorotate dehydrogenase